MHTLTTKSLMAILTLFWCLLSYDIAAAGEVKLRLKWFHQFQFAGYYQALEQGFYSDKGLNVTILERDPKISPVNEVVNGDVDFSISDSSLIQHRLNGDPVVIVAAIFQHSPLVLMSLASENISSPLDVVGKKVMYQKNVDDALILALFNEVNVAEPDFTFVPHNFDNDALLTGYTDVMSAYISNQPYLYRQKDIPVNIINPANYGIDFYGDMLFTSEKTMLDKELVINFRQASIDGWKHALDNPEKTIELILEKYNTKSRLTQASLEYEAGMTRRMIKPRLIEVGNISSSRFRRIADIYKERKMVPTNAKLEGLIYTDHIKTDDSVRDILKWFLILLTILAGIILVMGIITAKLNSVVRARTRELESAREAQLKINERLRLLAGFVSHDLRNPLGVIDSFATLLYHDKINENDKKDALQTISANAKKGLELVKNVLEFSALGSGKFKLESTQFKLCDLTLQATENFAQMAQEREIKINIECKDKNTVTADLSRLTQVIDNLLANAIKHAEAGTEIQVETLSSDKGESFKCTNVIDKTSDFCNQGVDSLYQSFGFGMEIVNEILRLHESELVVTKDGNRFIASFTLASDSD